MQYLGLPIFPISIFSVSSKGVRFLDLEGGIGFLGPIKGLGEDDTKNVF